MWKLRSDAYRKTIFLDNMTVLMSLVIFNSASVVSHNIATYATHSFLLLIYLSFHVFHVFIASVYHFK